MAPLSQLLPYNDLRERERGREGGGREEGREWVGRERERET